MSTLTHEDLARLSYFERVRLVEEEKRLMKQIKHEETLERRRQYQKQYYQKLKKSKKKKIKGSIKQKSYHDLRQFQKNIKIDTF